MPGMSAAGAAAGVAPPSPAVPPPPPSAVAVALGGGDEAAVVVQPPSAAAPVGGALTPLSSERSSFSSAAAAGYSLAEDLSADGLVEAGEEGAPSVSPLPPSLATMTALHLTATVCLALAAMGLAAFGIGTAVTAHAWEQRGHGAAHGGPAVAALLLVAAALVGVTAGLGAAASATAQRPRGVVLARSFAYAAGASGVVLAATAAGTAVTAAAVGRYGGAAGWAFGLVATLAAAVGGMVLVDAWRVLQGLPGGCCPLPEWEERSASLDSKEGGEGAGRGGESFGPAGESAVEVVARPAALRGQTPSGRSQGGSSLSMDGEKEGETEMAA